MAVSSGAISVTESSTPTGQDDIETLAQLGGRGHGARLAEGGLEAGGGGVVGLGEVDDGGVAAGDELGVTADPLAYEEQSPQGSGKVVAGESAHSSAMSSTPLVANRGERHRNG